MSILRLARIAQLGVLIVLVLTIPTSESHRVAAQNERQVWAFYLGFWSGHDAWNAASGVLDDRPSRGDYDSRERAVVRDQIAEARRAGIDAFVVSWRGTNDDAATDTIRALLKEAGRVGFRIGVVLDHFEGGDAATSRDSLSYLLKEYANHPAYLRYRGKPVVLFAFQRNLDWGGIRTAVDPSRRSLWISEGLKGEKLYGGAMDGMYAFNFAWTDGSPRFYERDQKATIGNGGSIFLPTIHPGWNEDKVARRDRRSNPTAARQRDGGAFLRHMWEGATSVHPDVVLVVSWNEFIENSHIEPSRSYGSSAIDTLGPLVAAWKGGSSGGGGSAGSGSGGDGGDGGDNQDRTTELDGLTAEGDARQRVRFNPGASLQKAIFSDGFVPNSDEFDLEAGGASLRGQRAEHLGSGAVRIYFVQQGRWTDLRIAERGRARGERERALLDEGERRQAIQFNPGAALQRAIFRDSFVPNSPEFRVTIRDHPYAAQRAEHLGTGEVRVYYAPVERVDQVAFRTRGQHSDDEGRGDDPDPHGDHNGSAPVYVLEGWDASAQRWVSSQVRLPAADVCTRLRWHVANIAEIYLEHEGHGPVPGSGEVGEGERLACLEASDRLPQRWILHVHLRDGDWIEVPLEVRGD